MPTFSANTYGTYSHVVPAYAVNVRFSIAGAGGGRSISTGSTSWNVAGGAGRAGDFLIYSRSTAYTLTFYLGYAGGNGTGGDGFGNAGAGGASPLSSLRGGNGYNHGGGAGAGAAVYDSSLNNYIVAVGGGGGGGRFGATHNQGYGAGIGGGATTGPISLRSGSNASAGNTGGGGGGSLYGVFGSNGGTAPGGGISGYGGNSSYRNDILSWEIYSGYLNYGNGFYSLSYDYAPPNIQYFTVSPTQIVRGNSATLSWGTSGNISTTTINPNIGSVSSSGTLNVSPTNDVTYSLFVQGSGGTANSSVVLDVLVPPTVTVTSDATNNTIVLGESVTITWSTSGDAAVANLTPGVGNVNINGSQTFTPTQDTTYTITASHPTAGEGSGQITITVIQPPSVEISGPLNVDYGLPVTLGYEAVNVGTLQLLILYTYLDGSTTTNTIELPAGDTSSGTFTNNVIYNDIGPSQIQYTIYGVGAGPASSLSDSEAIIVPINIDVTPDVIEIPESNNLVKDQQPVITPDEDTFLTLTVDDIDVPVEIKAEFPVQVQLDNDGIWKDVREV